MGRIVVAEDKLLPELVRIGKFEGYVPGLIIGQSSGQKDFIVHLARTPLPTAGTKWGNEGTGSLRANKRKSVEKLNDIQESWLEDHAKQVNRMLPGGMWVLGLFITGPGDAFAATDAQSKVSSLIKGINKALSKNTSLYGSSPSTEKLLLHLVSSTNKFVCKSVDVSNSAVQFRSTDCKFLNSLKWHNLESQYDFDTNPPYLISDTADKQPLKIHLEKILESFSKGVQKSLCTIDGEVRNNEDPLEVVVEKTTKKDKKQSQSNKKFQVNLFIPSETELGELSVSTILQEMNCTGTLASSVFVHEQATVAEALRAVKEDIIRSFASRLEMHSDSLMEEETGSPEEVMVVHEPPRRILIPLPHSQVMLCDYLFPGEGISEAITSIAELLGFNISESAVIKDFEGQPDQSELYNLTAGGDIPKHDDSCSSSSGHSLNVILTVVIALIVLIASLLIKFYLN